MPRPPLLMSRPILLGGLSVVLGLLKLGRHNNNNNINANVCGAIVMAEPLRQFTLFI